MPIPGGSVVDGSYLIRLTPRMSLARSGLSSIMLVSTVVFGVLFFLGLDNDAWPFALLGEASALVICCVAYLLFRTTFIGVTATTIEERGYWGIRTSFPRSDVASVVLASTYGRGSPDPAPQLIVRDRHGRRMLRMRGSFWTVEDMRSIIAAIDVSPTLPSEVMSYEEFFEHFPGTAYWFERRRVLAWIAIAGACVVGVALIFGIMHLVLMPIVG